MMAGDRALFGKLKLVGLRLANRDDPTAAKAADTSPAGQEHPGSIDGAYHMTSFLRSITLAVATLGAGLSANAGDLDFRLINESGVTLNEFYVTTAKVDSWGNDVLGKGTLDTGRSAVVNFPTQSDDCVYDLKMVFADGDVLTDTINLCETSTYTIS